MTINELLAKLGAPEFALPLIRRMIASRVLGMEGHFDDSVQLRLDAAAEEVSVYLANARLMRLSFAELEGLFNAPDTLETQVETASPALLSQNR
jgi:hypothetical protein